MAEVVQNVANSSQNFSSNDSDIINPVYCNLKLYMIIWRWLLCAGNETGSITHWESWVKVSLNSL